MPLEFSSSKALTLGVELELQLINTENYNLAPDAGDLLRRLKSAHLPGELKPEITQSMVEINSSIHQGYTSLHDEFIQIRDLLAAQARKMNVAICGGGTHPFQRWSDRRIFPTERFLTVSEKYGFLAKQFTVFGQHIHIGVGSGDDALYLCHALARYVPQFIALSASSPFYQGVDTAFDSSRLSVVNAFPLSGTAPPLLKWEEFNRYFDRLAGLGIVASMKDFYWDIRPKPEYGTIEIRVCDTPLSVTRATQLAAFAQSLASYLLYDAPRSIDFDLYLTYNTNRFQACRYGLLGHYIDPSSGESVTIRSDIEHTVAKIAAHAQTLDCLTAIQQLVSDVSQEHNDAHWLREQLALHGTLNDVVRQQTMLWMNA